MVRGGQELFIGQALGATGEGVRVGWRNRASFGDACREPKLGYQVTSWKCETGAGGQVMARNINFGKVSI